VDDQELLDRLVEDLSHICDVQLRTSCVSISLVGNAIRTILGRLSEALDVFQDRKVHMVTQSANDLNLTLVVDPGHADRLVQKLHQLLIAPQAQQRPEFGDSWSMMTGRDKTPVALPWWRHEATRLQTILGQQSSAYVYHLDSVRKAARRLLDLPSVDRVLYAMKANHHPDILRTLHQEGAGFDCVSMEEVRYLRSQVPGISTSDILFTPNFAERAEYLEALSAGVRTTIDNLHPLLHWPELFAGQQVFLRVDLNAGYGHHRKVITSGARSKFGIAIDHLQELQPHLKKHRIRVTGLHAHTGSGVIEAGVWGEQLQRMLSLLPMFPEVGVVDLGGGLGVPERAGQPHLDVQRVNQTLKDVLADVPVKLWLEPGRYLVAESGVLLSRVTQLKSKGEQNYVGLATGMNSLIRPALYGAFHEIVNLSRPDEPSTHKYTVVGPICESGDVLGESRFLPECHEGDILLIANAGAYGRVMSSNYNRRAPAEERVFPE
jgi:diaminopimelate decarboxylase/aspartate kinase